MNKHYRVVWSQARNAFVVAHEAASACTPSSTTRSAALSATAAALLSLGATHSQAACPAAVNGVITVSSAASNCSLGNGESIVVNSSGTVTSSTAISASGVSAGSIQNAGTLNGTGDTGIDLYNNAIVLSLTNTGTINALSYGVIVSGGATVSAGIVNSGLISAGEYAIELNGGTVAGGISNSGTLAGNSYGLLIEDGSLVSGGITNTGHIVTTDDSGIRIRLSEVIGGITNTGTIDAHLTSYDEAGITLDQSTLTGSIVNQGLINVLTTSEWAYGINLDNSTMTGSIVNSGTISVTAPNTSSAHGIRLASSTITGGITNTGLIDAANLQTDTGYGISLDSSSVSGAVLNTGTIVAVANSNGYGVYLNGSTATGGITNSGRIEGNMAGIGINSSSVGPVVNLQQGIIQAGNGIEVDSGSTLTGGITNAGTIIGENRSLELNNAADAFTVTNTGTLQGGVNIGINTLDLNGSSARVLSSTTGSGIVNVNGTFTSEATFDVGTFNVASGGVFHIRNGVTVAGGGFNNAGTVEVGNTSQTITGTYSQAAGGIFRLSLADATSNYGKLLVTGNATLANGSGVHVDVQGSPAIANGTTVTGVITSGTSLTVDPATVQVTDNSALFSFSAATVSSPGTALDLIIAADPNGLPSAVRNNRNPAAIGAAGALQQLRNTTVPAAMQPVFDRLDSMTEAEASDAISQTLPAVVGAAAQAGITALHSMNRVIQSRIESVQGLSSGDGTPDRFAWVRAFGNWSDQKDHKDVSGYESDTGGIVIAADAPVSPSVRAGAGFTYAKSRIKSKSSSAPSQVDVDTYELLAYASQNLDPRTDINYQFDIGKNVASSSRNISFMGTRAEADFDSLSLHAGVGIGRVYGLSPSTNVTPSIRFDYTRMKTDGYTETGAGPLNLRVNDQTYREFLLTTDAKLSHQIKEGLKLIGNASLGYDFINQQVKTTSLFTGGGPVFETRGLEVSPWFYRAGIGLVQEDKKGLEYSLRYDMEGRSSGYLNQTVSVRVRWAF